MLTAFASWGAMHPDLPPPPSCIAVVCSPYVVSVSTGSLRILSEAHVASQSLPTTQTHE